MQLFGFVRMPVLLGPSFTPFTLPQTSARPKRMKAVEVSPTKTMSRPAQSKQKRKKSKAKKD
jgi:hypothetical protein